MNERPDTPAATHSAGRGGRRRVLGALAGLGATLAAAPLATLRAQPSTGGWPDRPVRLIVNAPPGGTADIAARVVAEGLAPALGKPVVVETKAGGSGLIGLQEVLRSAPDGHTLLVSVNSLLTEVPHSVKFPADPLKDLRPIADIYIGGLVLVGHASVPAATLAELLAWVKAQPQGVSYASYSPGTGSHIVGLQLAGAAGVKLTHVGYRGSPPAMQDLLAGQVPLMFNGVGNVLTQIRDGRLRAYAVATTTRSEFLPDVPTFAELGYPELVSSVWMGLWSAPQVPAPIQQRLQAEMQRLLGRPELRQRLKDLGFTPAQPRTPDELMRTVVADYEKTGTMLKAVGYVPGQ